jgi:uncharacterized protein
MNETYNLRLGLIPALAERSATGHIGRTALTKYLYFLQTLKGFNLCYQFSLYSYGPFQSDVLADLARAEALGIVAVKPVEFSGGYGYKISAGSGAAAAKQRIAAFLTQHDEDVKWLFDTFGNFNAAELELASTIVYVDQELFASGKRSSIAEIVERVSGVKPHFSKEKIEAFVRVLLGKRVLTSVADPR